MSLEYKMKRYSQKHLWTTLTAVTVLLYTSPIEATEKLQLKSAVVKTGVGHSMEAAHPSLQLSVAGEFTLPWMPLIPTLGLSTRKTNDDPSLNWANFSLDFSLAYEFDHLSWVPGLGAGGRVFGAGSQAFLTGTAYVKRIYPSGYFVCISGEFAQPLSQQETSFITYLVGVGYDFDMNRF